MVLEEILILIKYSIQYIFPFVIIVMFTFSLGKIITFGGKSNNIFICKLLEIYAWVTFKNSEKKLRNSLNNQG